MNKIFWKSRWGIRSILEPVIIDIVKGLGRRLSEERLNMYFVVHVCIKKSLSRDRANIASHNPDKLV